MITPSPIPIHSETDSPMASVPAGCTAAFVPIDSSAVPVTTSCPANPVNQAQKTGQNVTNSLKSLQGYFKKPENLGLLKIATHCFTQMMQNKAHKTTVMKMFTGNNSVGQQAVNGPTLSNLKVLENSNLNYD